jgi:hypothetical protein
MATGPQPSFNFHARIDRDTEERRRRLQEQTGLSASQLVREAFRELERKTLPPQDDSDQHCHSRGRGAASVRCN